MKIKTILLFLLIIPIAFALVPMPYPETGINQYYSINFDNEGDASVGAKLEIQNYQQEPIENIQIEIPGNNIRIINIFQEIYQYKEDCINWVKVCDDDNTNCDLKCENYNKYQTWPPTYKVIDYSVDELSKSGLYELNLPEPIKEGEKATVIIYYKTNNYAEKSLGVWNFNFETIKLNYDTNYVNVGISVNKNLHLKGVKSNIDYIDNAVFSQELKISASEDVSRFSSYIGSGYYNENAQSLDPMESFRVKGSYSSSSFLLYLKTILISLIIFSASVLGLIYGFKKIKNKNKKYVLTAIITSFVSISLWILSYFFLRFLNNIIYYPMYPVISFVFVIIVTLLSLFLIFGPAIYFGFKNGIKASVIYSVSFLIAIIVFGIIGIFLLYLLNPYNPPVYRTMLDSVEAVSY